MRDLFPEHWKRSIKRFLLGLDAWIDFSLFRSASGARESYERFSTFMDRFHVSGWRRWLNELFSEGATLGAFGLVVLLALAIPAFRETSDDDWLKKSELAVTFLDRYGNEVGSRGIRHNDAIPLDQFPDHLVKAVLSADSDDVVDAVARAQALKGVLHMPEFQAIAAACKRMRNILKQAKEAGVAPAAEFQYLPESSHEEKSLAAYVETQAPRVEAHRRNREYQDALFLLSTAKEPVNAFFDKVMVMVDDERIRSNRLALLQTLLKEFSTIADFSEIVTEGKESKESSKT